MSSALHAVLARLFLAYDATYRVIFRLQPIDELLFINRAVYKGPEREFADGTRLRAGDPIGIIHFNNRFMSEVQARSGKRAAFTFGAALVRSMLKVGQQLSSSPVLKDLKAISGITWFKAHGSRIGFESEALPPGRRKRFLRAHFRLLLRLLFPHLAKRENHRLEPHQFWITRNQLRQLVVSGDRYAVKRLMKHDNERL